MKNPTTSVAGFRKSEKGLSLVELMIALTLSLILVAGVIQLFVSSKATFNVNEAVSRIQENGRFALQFLQRDLRQAGYKGCYTGDLATADNILNNAAAFSWDVSQAVNGYDNVTGGSVGSGAITGIVAGTDVVIVRGMDTDGIRLVPPYSDSAQLFTDPSATYFKDGDILMVTDCVQASIFQASNVQAAGGKMNVVHSNSGAFTPGNSQPHLNNSYQDATVARLYTAAYYIRNNAYGIPSLYRSSLKSSGGNTAYLDAEELVEGVDTMQVLYGEDTTGDGIVNQYKKASAVTDWSRVLTLRIGLLVRSAGTVPGDKPSSYTVLDQTITPNDDRLRRLFSTTIALRNKTL